MIGYIRGQVLERSERYVIVATDALGYKVFVSTGTLSHLTEGGAAELWTHLAVREDALDLYGFREKSERDFFELLITVSGIGPRSALAILSLADPETLRRAIVSGQSDYLTKVSGIGRKSAEKIVLELRDKLGALGDFLVGAGELNQEGEALEALQAIGYSLREARTALKKVSAEVTDTNERIKAALRVLGK